MKFEHLPIKITTPIRMNLIFLLGFVFLLFIGGMNIYYGTMKWGPKDIGMIALFGFAVCWFLYRVLFPKTRFLIDQKGIWTQKTGFLKWSDVSSLHVEIRNGYKGARNETLVLNYENDQKEVAYEFISLNISKSDYDEKIWPLIEDIFNNR